MRSLVLCLLVLTAFSACKEKKEVETSPDAVSEAPVAEMDTLEQLAAQYGFSQWDQVNEIRFTFNVDRPGGHSERSWSWKPKQGEVTMMTETDTVTYLRSEVDSTLTGTDAGFINDKYWLLAPYQWVWDRESFTYSLEKGIPAPLSGAPSDKLTIVYGSEGGYTPGDAYDFYLGADSMITEWAFRKGNQPEPNLITTWEGYEEHNGLKISTMHQGMDGNFKIYFTGVSVR